MEIQLQLIIEGNYDAFTEIFMQYYARTLAFLRKRVYCKEEAADLTQQCFLRLWQYHACLSKKHPLEQQLFVIARSLLLNHLEKKKVAARAVHILSSQKEPTICPQLEAETHDLISTALQTLPAAEKKVIRLKYYEQYSNKEISNTLAISIKTVEARVSSAYKHLRSILSIF